MLAVFLLIGSIAARARFAAERTQDLIVAGRTMPLLLALLTMTATWVDGGYLLGTAEGAYKSSFALQPGLFRIYRRPDWRHARKSAMAFHPDSSSGLGMAFL